MAQEIWGVADVAAYRGVTRGAINQQLQKGSYPSPDFLRPNGDRFWLPKTIKPWADSLPGRGSYARSSARGPEGK